MPRPKLYRHLGRWLIGSPGFRGRLSSHTYDFSHETREEKNEEGGMASGTTNYSQDRASTAGSGDPEIVYAFKLKHLNLYLVPSIKFQRPCKGKLLRITS